MHLISATDDFVLRKATCAGFPILLDRHMQSVAPVNSFMRYYLSRGPIGSKKSWASTGRALYDYFSFLEAHELCWDDVKRGEDRSLVEAYRDYCLDTANLAINTVRQRLVYVCKFYEYAKNRQWIAALPFAFEDRILRRDAALAAHMRGVLGKISVRDVSPKRRKDLPSFLGMAEIRSLLAAATNVHHRMLIRMGLQTGMRKEELASFPVSYLFDPDRAGRTERSIRVRLDPQDGSGMRTKGNKPRDIFIARSFFKDLWFYAIHYRGERAQLNTENYDTLFLNQCGEPYSDAGRSMTAVVRAIGARVGVKVWPHKLRHTYATHTLHAMQSGKSDIAPLVFVQRQLGHESLQTTMVYLHLINERADNAVLAYGDELNDLISGAKDEQEEKGLPSN